MNQRVLVVTLAILAALFISFNSSALAQQDADYVVYRQKVMQGIGANMGSIGQIFKKKLPLQGNVEQHALIISRAATLISSAFKKQVTSGKTDAKPEIWQDWSKFQQAAKALQEQSAKLARVAKSGNVKAIIGELKATGKRCGGCHKKFRKPKEESYKRK